MAGSTEADDDKERAGRYDRRLWQLRHGIGGRLLALVLLFSSIITLLLTLVQLYVDFHRDLASLEYRFAEIQSVYPESLSQAVWDVDERQLTLELKGILHLPDISEADIHMVPDGTLIASQGSRVKDAVISHDFSLFHLINGAPAKIGILHVEANLSPIFSRLFDEVVFILVSHGAKTFVVSLFIMYVTHWLITSHLAHIAEFVRKIDLTGARAPVLRLRRRSRAQADELDDVTKALNVMSAKLLRAYADVRRNMAQKVEAEAERHRLLERLVNTQEEERRRIARELHDQMGQDLTGLSLGLKSLELSVQGEAARGTLAWLQSLTSQIGQVVHRAAWELRPTSLDDVGLGRALETYLADWGQRFGIRVDFHTTLGESDRFPSNIETTAFRIVQEALTNVLKHAEASTVSLVIEFRDGWLKIIVEDNGRGFDAEAAAAQGRLGLAGMRERLALVEGTLTLDSVSGGGTTLYLRIPTVPL
jgi:signal transduction histidine kinase